MTVLATSALIISPRPGAYTDTDTAGPTPRPHPWHAGSYVDTEAFSHLAGGAQRAGSYVDRDVLTRPAPDSARPGSYIDTATAAATRRA